MCICLKHWCYALDILFLIFASENDIIVNDSEGNRVLVNNINLCSLKRKSEMHANKM